MLAFLIWDERESRRFAARDRFGIEPLYLTSNVNGIAFGSEVKQLLDLPRVSCRMNVKRVNDFLASGISDHTHETMFADIIQVRGGEVVIVDASRSGALVPIVRRGTRSTPTRFRISNLDMLGGQFGVSL
jgi:asparagine synthase (glutamine-hydrolysing)